MKNLRLEDAEPVLPVRRRGRPASPSTELAEVQSLDRAIALLDLLASGEGLGLSDLARQAELPPSTAHRLLSTLLRRGLVSHQPGDGLWTIGPGLFQIGSAYLRIRKLPELARPITRALLAEEGETVNVSMLDRTHLVCVAQAESHAAMRAFFRLGSRLPVHATGAGKSILAAGADELQRELLGDGPLPTLTANTHSSRAALMRDVDAVRGRGWAIDDEEHTTGMRCVSACILNEWSEPIGAISISAPAVRMPPERLNALGHKIRQAAATLSRLYSGRAATTA